MLAGDQEAFDTFFNDYFPSLYRFALTRVRGNEDAAEEVAQSTLCKAIGKLQTYRGEAALFTWLCTFCRYELSAYFRKRRHEAPSLDLVEDRDEFRAALDSIGADLDDPSVQFDREELARLARVVLDQLSPSYSRALEWKYLEGISVKEIAERLQLSPKAAESILSRARVAFRDLFQTLTEAPSAAEPSR